MQPLPDAKELLMAYRRACHRASRSSEDRLGMGHRDRYDLASPRRMGHG
jgi:hypothetical protein